MPAHVSTTFSVIMGWLSVWYDPVVGFWIVITGFMVSTVTGIFIVNVYSPPLSRVTTIV